MTTSAPPTPTHYQVLNLTPHAIAASRDPARLISRAYHRALLAHHPDKSRPGTAAAAAVAAAAHPPPTVDSIRAARDTLSRPTARAAYDTAILLGGAAGARLRRNQQQHSQAEVDFQTGMEVVDLSDLESSSSGPGDGGDSPFSWSRPCRCGNDRGFVVSERDLEEVEVVAGQGELLVGCQDCSLWIKVYFTPVVEE